VDEKKLEKQVEFFERRPDHVLVGTGGIAVNAVGKELFRYLLPYADEGIRKIILAKNCFVHVSVLFQRDVVLACGGYNEDQAMRNVEDYDLWLKLGTTGKFANLPIYAVRYVVYDEGISSMNRLEQVRKNLFLIKKYRDSYPGYIYARARYVIRLMIYGYINLKFLSRITAFFTRL